MTLENKPGDLLSIPLDQQGAKPRLVTETQGIPVGADPAIFDSAISGINDALETSQAGTTGLGVFVQDQTTPAIFLKANKVVATSTVAVQPSIGDLQIELADTTGMVVDDLLIATSLIGTRFYQGRILANVADVLTLDTPLDYAFEVGQEANATTTNMAVDGSVTPQIFSARAAEPAVGLGIVADVTRLNFFCITNTAVDLGRFGDIAGGLTNGLVVRRTDGITINQFNIKTNGELSELTGGDWIPYDAQNANQGQHGFVARLTYGGQDKVGVVVRLGPGDDLEFIIQDDLSSLGKFEILLEGHVVQ